MLWLEPNGIAHRILDYKPNTVKEGRFLLNPNKSVVTYLVDDNN
jgi:hypothetical protein